MRSARGALATCAGLAILYAAFLTRTYYWDGVLFSLNIEAAARGELPVAALFHPNHLLYSPFGYLLYVTVHLLGFGLRAITVLQLANVVLSAITAAVVFRVAACRTASLPSACFCTVLFAFGATWWKFSTDADVYVIAVLLMLFAVMFASQNPSRLIAAAACHSAAMLFHELAVFAYAPVLAAIVLDESRPVSKRFGRAAGYISGTAVCVLAVYALAYSTTDHHAYPTFISWVTSYAADSSFTTSWRQLGPVYLGSYLKLFAGGKPAFLREYLSIPVGIGLAIAVAGILAGVLLWRRRTVETRKPQSAILWIWIAVYAAFLTSWDPGSAFHKLFIWPAVVLLAAGYVSRGRAWLAFAIALAGWNFAAFIYPHAHATADPVLTLAQKVDRELPKTATVYYAALDPDDWYLEYFAPGRRWLKLPVPLDAPGPICFETTALEQLGGKITTTMKWELVNAHHNIRLECTALSPSAK